MAFGNIITLWCSGGSELCNYSTLFHVCAKLVTKILSSTIGSYKFDLSVTMIFNFTLKFFELFKCIRLVFHQVNISISTQIIRESHEITISTVCRHTHWTAY